MAFLELRALLRLEIAKVDSHARLCACLLLLSGLLLVQGQRLFSSHNRIVLALDSL